MTPSERKAFMQKTACELLTNTISMGVALKTYRKTLLNMSQSDFSKLVKISRKTISDIENNRGNYSIDTYNCLFKPFGLSIGLTPIDNRHLNDLISLLPDKTISVSNRYL